MKSRKIIRILSLAGIAASLYCCKKEEIILHGEINGVVIDAETGQPLQAAIVKLIPSDETITTGIDGTFLFINKAPGGYEIQASKLFYSTSSVKIDLFPAKTQEINFELNGIPVPDVSHTYLDFGLDLTSLFICISNIGTGKLLYIISGNQSWINIYPSSGEVTNETDTIKININRAGLSDNIYKEIIKIYSLVDKEIMMDTVEIYLNGVLDNRDYKYYKTVRIGDQIWMAENLNIGTSLDLNQEQPISGNIGKYCYDCDIYGGLYTWHAMMQNGSSDTAMIGTTQGICPVGWHVPTYKEWQNLINYLGDNASGKLKETGTAHWVPPNTGATNETGFSALPGGALWGNWEWNSGLGQSVFTNRHYTEQGNSGSFWTAEAYYDVINVTINARVIQIRTEGLISNFWDAHFGSAVRCVKDLPK